MADLSSVAVDTLRGSKTLQITASFIVITDVISNDYWYSYKEILAKQCHSTIDS